MTYRDVPREHQLKIALKTLTMSDAGAAVMGGMSKKEAVNFLRSMCGYSNDDLRRKLTAFSHTPAEIDHLLGEQEAEL